MSGIFPKIPYIAQYPIHCPIFHALLNSQFISEYPIYWPLWPRLPNFPDLAWPQLGNLLLLLVLFLCLLWRTSFFKRTAVERQREHQKEEAIRQEFEQSCAAGQGEGELEEQETALMARQ